MIEYIIGRNDAGLRADRFLFKATSAPSSLIYKTFRKKDVKINGKWIKEDYPLCEGDILRIYIKEDFRTQKEIADCPLTAEIVFEDENIIIFNKPTGLMCQPDKLHPTGTLSDMLKSYLASKGEYEAGAESSFSPALCNRIDTNTNGLVIGAKNAQALRDMNEMIRLRFVKKYYLCSVEGAPYKKQDNVNAFIKKDANENKSEISSTDGKEISMQYTVIETKNNISEIEVLLHTGRGHQIRAYFSSIGCPLVGDKKYGAKSCGGQKLTAYKLVFDFPESYNGVLSYLNKKKFTV